MPPIFKFQRHKNTRLVRKERMKINGKLHSDCEIPQDGHYMLKLLGSQVNFQVKA